MSVMQAGNQLTTLPHVPGWQILLNGHKSSLSYGVSAYVTQDEMLIGTLSVREHLRYVAMLRLCGVMPHQVSGASLARSPDEHYK